MIVYVIQHNRTKYYIEKHPKDAQEYNVFNYFVSVDPKRFFESEEDAVNALPAIKQFFLKYKKKHEANNVKECQKIVRHKAVIDRYQTMLNSMEMRAIPSVFIAGEAFNMQNLGMTPAEHITETKMLEEGYARLIRLRRNNISASQYSIRHNTKMLNRIYSMLNYPNFNVFEINLEFSKELNRLHATENAKFVRRVKMQ